MENQFTNENKRSADLETYLPFHSCDFFSFLFLKYSFKLASRSSSNPMLLHKKKTSYYHRESALDYSSLLDGRVKVNACPRCTVVSV